MGRQEVTEGLGKVTVGIEPVSIVVFVQGQNLVSIELDLIIRLLQVILEHVVTRRHGPRKQLEAIHNRLEVVRGSLHVLPLYGIQFVENFTRAFAKNGKIRLLELALSLYDDGLLFNELKE